MQRHTGAAVAGAVAAPQIAAICNRADWTMGKVKDVYIKYGEAGDQHIGRVVAAGLTVLLNAKYAWLFATFFHVTQNSSPDENECTQEDIDYAIATIFPTFQEKVSFKPVAVTCAAALF